MNRRGAWQRSAVLIAGAALALPSLAELVIGEPYTAIEWLQPQPQQTVHDNSGDVRVELQLTPPLQLRAGHRLQVVVDGKPLPELWATQTGMLSNLNRGEHRLQAFVMAGDGTRVAASEPLTFYLWQASRLFPQR